MTDVIEIELTELMSPGITAPPDKTWQDYVPDFIIFGLRRYAPKFLRPNATPLERWCVVQMLRLSAAYARIQELENPAVLFTHTDVEADVDPKDLN